MTEQDEKPKYCAKHDWHEPPERRIIELGEDGPVYHPTEMMRWCMNCAWSETVKRQPK